MKALFVISVTFLGFVIGLFYGSVSISPNIGFAGPAELLVYGIVIGVIAFVLSLVINRKLNPAMRKKITIGFLLISLLPIGWFLYRLNVNREFKGRPALPPRPVTSFEWKAQPNMDL
jgi:hypothetical protein